MTREEAIEYAKSVSFCAGCNEPQWSEDAADICERCKHRQFFELVIDALEKQEKYKWHDLLKNPEDLPPKYHKVLIYSRLFGYSAAAITITGWYDGTSTRTVADAWCEINPFKTDTNVSDKDTNVRSKEDNK